MIPDEQLKKIAIRIINRVEENRSWRMFLGRPVSRSSP